MLFVIIFQTTLVKRTITNLVLYGRNKGCRTRSQPRQFNLSLLHGLVEVSPLLHGDGDLLSDGGQVVEVKVGEDDGLLGLRGGDDLAPGIDDGGVTPGDVGGGVVARRARRGDVELVVHGPRFRE